MASFRSVVAAAILHTFIILPASAADWQFMEGAARDVGAGADGAVWVIGTNAVFGGHGIYRWTGSGWEEKPGGGVRIAVGSANHVWVVNDKDEIYRWTGTGWTRMPGAAKDIGVGADGAVWVIGTKRPIDGGGFIPYRWTGNGWEEKPLSGLNIAVGSASNIWMARSETDGRRILRWHQIRWSQIPAIDTSVEPAIATLSSIDKDNLSKFTGAVYVVAVSRDHRLRYTSTDTPAQWQPWRDVAQGIQFASDTPPILIEDEATLHLFARARDDDLYMASLPLGGSWTNVRRITQGRPLKGPLSVALTRRRAPGLDVREFHVASIGVHNRVEYRRFDISGSRLGPIELIAGTVRGSIGSDGNDQVMLVAQTVDDRLVVKAKRNIASRWSAFNHFGEINYGPGSSYFDLSNIVFFAGAYHIAFDVKSRNVDEFGSEFVHDLKHGEIRPGVANPITIRSITDYVPAGPDHPLTSLVLYRNKLMASYRDVGGSVRYALWDNADPLGPWIGRRSVADGRTSRRPAVAVVNRCMDLRRPECIVSGFGHDIVAAVKDIRLGVLWSVNFSRAVFEDRLKQIGAAVHWCTDYVQPPGGHRMVACPALPNKPAITELPVFSAVGYATTRLPDWLMSNALHRVRQASGQSMPHTTWVHTQNIGAAYVGPNVNIDRQMEQFAWWEEGGHVIAGALGLCDGPPPQGDCVSASAPNPNLLPELIKDTATANAFRLFAEDVNTGRSCRNGTGSDNRRCRGFTGWGNNYDVGTRQHSFLYVLLFYHQNGDQLRSWIGEDLQAGDDLLQRKYDWVRQYIFRGVEFHRDAAPSPQA